MCLLAASPRNLRHVSFIKPPTPLLLDLTLAPGINPVLCGTDVDTCFLVRVSAKVTVGALDGGVCSSAVPEDEAQVDVEHPCIAVSTDAW